MELKLTPQQIIRRKAAGQPIGPEDVQTNKRHVITIRLENTIGALNRVINMFSARGFNLESVVVGETSDKSISRMRSEERRVGKERRSRGCVGRQRRDGR